VHLYLLATKSTWSPWQLPRSRRSKLLVLSLLLLLIFGVLFFCGPTSGPGTFKLVDSEIGPADSLGLSSDGCFLACGSRSLSGNLDKYWEGHLKIWDYQKKVEVVSLQHSQWVRSVCFSADGNYLAIGTGSSLSGKEGFLNYKEKPGEVVVYQLPKFNELKRFPFDGRVLSVEFSPDSKRLAAAVGEKGYQQSHVRIWETAGFKETMVIGNLGNWSPSILFTPDSKTLVVGDMGADMVKPGVVKLYQMKDGGQSSEFSVQAGNVSKMALSPNGKILGIISGNGGPAKFFDFPKGTEYEIGNTVALSFSSDGKYLVETSRRGGGPNSSATINLFSLETKSLLSTWTEKQASFPCVTYSPTHKAFVIGGKTVKLLPTPEKK
jgi:WD40 repeat protein